MGKGSVDQDPADRCGDNSDKDQARLIVHHCALNKRDPNQSRGLPVSAGLSRARNTDPPETKRV